ncbi:hypothetical protein ABEW34_21975 [Paenibacillus algorifonticola]|uniref:hypothetical protein n=1 Tax=Paenibacillus algorifonticola TaxID=684063 RepID=UPI003D2B773C
MAKTDWKFNDIVTETDMNELGQEVNDAKAELGDMSIVPTVAKDAAGAIGELNTQKLSKAGDKMTGALIVEAAAREISAGTWADMSANSTGFALFAQNCYTAHNNEYRYSNTHASLGARGIRFNHTNASVEYFDTGAVATTADLEFTPNWISMRPDTAATANRAILRDANGRAKVTAPAAADDVARLDTVQTFGYGATSGTGSAYAAAIGLVSALTEGLRVTIKLHAASGANPTLNINGLGAKAILKSSGSAPAAGLLKAGSIYTLVYNGTAFTLQGEGGEYGTALAADVLAGKTIGTEAGLVTGTMPLRGGEEYAGWVRAEMGPTGPTAGRMHLRTPLGAYLNGGGNGVGYMGIFADDPDFIAENFLAGKEAFGLMGTLIQGKRVVTGSVVSSSSTSLFQSLSGNSSVQYIEITGHGFVPGLIICDAVISPDNFRRRVSYIYTGAYGPSNTYPIIDETIMTGSIGQTSTGDYYSTAASVSLTAALIRLPTRLASYTFNYYIAEA